MPRTQLVYPVLPAFLTGAPARLPPLTCPTHSYGRRELRRKQAEHLLSNLSSLRKRGVSVPRAKDFSSSLAGGSAGSPRTPRLPKLFDGMFTLSMTEGVRITSGGPWGTVPEPLIEKKCRFLLCSSYLSATRSLEIKPLSLRLQSCQDVSLRTHGKKHSTRYAAHLFI